MARDRRAAATWFRLLLAAAVVVVVFGFAIPRFADYGEAWAAIAAMDVGHVAAIALVGAWNLYTYWPVLRAGLPGLRTREAAVVNQASTAIANTVPGGGAVALAVTYRMQRAWGFSNHAITNQIVATGIGNALMKFLMPVVAIGAVTVTGELEGVFFAIALVGLVAATALLAAAFVALRRDRTARRAGDAIERRLAALRRSAPVGADDTPRLGARLVELRLQLLQLARRRGRRLLVATMVSHLSLYVVLLVTLRAVGLGESDVSWSMVLAAFAFVRLLSAIPVTPGGFGVVELGYVGVLTSEAPPGAEGLVTAGVLVFRAVTFALPVLFGSVSWIVFHAASSWRRPDGTRGLQP